mmetsp:Transcript_20875/g.25838  ORF Transcript_20875/g.25838 Transcript_20875/m.25838 type:complete len:303 (-) Transcript_20875:53-961(-)
MKLAYNRLTIDPSQGPSLLAFYQNAIGMAVLRETKTATKRVVWLGFPSNQESSALEFHIAQKCQPYEAIESKDTYWKIGLALQDVDLGRKCLLQNGISVTQPRQFRDIGYLCHFTDPVGYKVELLQEDFESNVRSIMSPDPQYPLGQPSTIGQITLRVKSAKESIEFYNNTFGMRLLSRQSVGSHFVLYFLGFTADILPNADINAVENREWLWKRPYTTLELLYDESSTTYTSASEDQHGFEGISLEISSQNQWDKTLALCRANKLLHQDVYFSEIYQQNCFQLYDPDNVLITVIGSFTKNK